MSNFMGVGIFWIGLNWADLGCWRLTLRMTMPFVTAHLEIFHCMHHPVIPKFDLYFTFCSTLNALSERTSK